MPVWTTENHETGVDLLPTLKLGTSGMVGVEVNYRRLTASYIKSVLQVSMIMQQFGTGFADAIQTKASERNYLEIGAITGKCLFFMFCLPCILV